MGAVAVTFRRLVDDDLPLLHRWLNEPGIVRWWEGDDVSWAAVQHDYGQTTTDPYLEHWLAHVGTTPVGWIQCYAIAEEPEEAARWWALGVDRDVAGIDYLLGEPDRRRAGLGSAMIRAFVDDIVFPLHPQWTQVGADPHEDNVASWRALEKAGFRFVGHTVGPDGRGRLMVRDR
ncbi:MAG TPA: GNAT family N-acetyltransferase [Acidimicrobiales bacterium]|nr:GNAT family N-acetyltransferase [Acidimicrobiales bacterium]